MSAIPMQMPAPIITPVPIAMAPCQVALFSLYSAFM